MITRTSTSWFAILVALLALARPDTAICGDVDTGLGAIELAKSELPDLPRPAGRNRWVRLRGIELARKDETRAALQNLRNHGLQLCILLRLPEGDWLRKYLPDDLGPIHEDRAKLGAAFGDLVDAWEIDNEPDLGFVPESAERYAAFLKASYLGLKNGIASRRAINRSTGQKTAVSSPLVLMGSLGLPPGPWLERFAANDGFLYTDGFNYHYYGYADDFSSVYRQHGAASHQLGTAKAIAGAKRRKLPVFVTEIGYGMLGKEASETKEGRLRQWAWFSGVSRQLANLGVEAAMAFYVPPFFDIPSSTEFGLTSPPKIIPEGKITGKPGAPSWRAGGIRYETGDFQTKKPAPWMELIGQAIDGNEVTPALAFWLSNPSRRGKREPIAPGEFPSKDDWWIATGDPSPIVIDFLPGADLAHVKRFNASFVTGKELAPPVQGQAPVGQPPIPVVRPKPAKAEEFILQVRTRNGNLFEVYPTRQATPEWQTYLEPRDNFTMAFYGRAALPWRFQDNNPAALVVVMYPKSLPVTYEFRYPQLIRLGTAPSTRETASAQEQRFGRGTIVLYNFSDAAVEGRIELPGHVTIDPIAKGLLPGSTPARLVIGPHERREIPVVVTVPWERYLPIDTPITFVPENQGTAPARHLTRVIPDIGGLPSNRVATVIRRAPVEGNVPAQGNWNIAATRRRANEEIPGVRPAPGAFAYVQPGAAIQASDQGFSITVSSLPAGMPQRIEVEIPWDDSVSFVADDFLFTEFRLKP